MSLTVGQFAFLPWLKTGVGAAVARVDGSTGSEPRTTLPLQVRFNADPALADGVTLELFGPGEVATFDTLTVTRTWPRAGVMDAETNYFPQIEFDQADLPWRYTPARATPGDRLTPWITLVVLDDAEIKRLVPPDGKHLGTVEIRDARALPRSSQLWAWAHVQVAGETTVDEARAAALMSARSGAITSRLMSPRRMRPHRGYTALVVPTFQRGVLKGLGQDPGAIDALVRAWGDAPAGPLRLPVYYHWRFGTGPDGDFESLARLLKPFEAPDSVGIRDVDVSAPSPTFPPANPAPLGLRGMLTALNTPETPWDSTARLNWIKKLKALLNLPADRAATPGTPKTVTPPLYGQWPAATDRCEADVLPERPLWFQELNVDPRLRIGAGLGTRVVQVLQEALMVSAWNQVDRVRQLNEELRQAQLAREMAMKLATRHVFTTEPETVLMLTAPLHARVKASPTTVRAVLSESPIPRGVFEGAFRRIARPLGPAGRRQGRAVEPAAPGLLTRLNEGKLSAAFPPPRPSGIATLESVADTIAGPSVGQAQVDAARNRALWLRLLGWIAIVLAIVLFFVVGWLAAVVVAAVGGAAFAYARREQRRAADLARRIAVRDGAILGDLIRGVTPPANYAPAVAPPGGAPRTLPTAPPGTTPSAVEIRGLQDALATMLDRQIAPTTPIRVMQQVDLGALRTTLAQNLNPRRTVAQAYAGRYVIGGAIPWKPADPLEPILAAPEFPQPMYRPLAQLNKEWLLPGFDKIPVNSATLLKSNQRMIEAYMAGLNHEMARELLWREYPTTQRATYFRQFWDTAGYAAPPGGRLTAEQLRDITPMHTWTPPSDLRDHSPRPPVAGSADYLVLFLRGDLLRRYPNTLVYANRAKWGSEGREIDDPANEAEAQTKMAHPLFSGFLDPDANFFGFALTKEQVLGGGTPQTDPGWYFVLAEPSGEPRFGLDEPASTLADSGFGLPVSGANWNGFGWANLVGSRSELDSLTTIDLTAARPDTASVTDATTRRWHANREPGSRASDIAYVTLQRPMRVAFHAAEMIP